MTSPLETRLHAALTDAVATLGWSVPPGGLRRLAGAMAPLLEPHLTPLPTQTDRPLSRKQLEAVAALAAGETYEETAQRLGVSPTSIRYRYAAVCQRLGVPNGSAAVARALALGLLPLGDYAAPSSPAPHADPSDTGDTR